MIGAYGYYLIEDREAAVNPNARECSGRPSLANTGDALVLQDAANAVIDAVNSTGRPGMRRCDHKGFNGKGEQRWRAAMKPELDYLRRRGRSRRGELGTAIWGRPAL